MSITPAFPQSDIEEIRFLCPGSSDNDIEKALYKYHGDKNLAVKDLLNINDQKPQPKPPGTGPRIISLAALADSQCSSLRRRVAGLKNGRGRYSSVSSGSAPQYSDQTNVRQQHTTGKEVRTEEVQCGMCQQIITLQMPTMRGGPLRARATCPHCQQLNEFDIPALQTTSPLSTVGGFAQSPPAFTTAPSSAAPPMPYSPQSHATAQAHAGVPPQGLTMASQAQYGLPATMQMQQTAVGVPVPELTGVQRALLVGINYYGSNCELSGCIPDVHNMKRLLVETYHWNPNDIKLLTDDGQNEAPTRENIIRYMHWLVRDAKPGDIFFFHYSGHGAQQEDPLHLEEDGMNETIIPVDVGSQLGLLARTLIAQVKKAGQITDDEIFQILVAPLPSGVRLTSVMDCCHSGTGNAIRARPGVTYVDLIDELNNEMRRKHMSQRPQLSSSQVFPLDRPFNLTDILPNQNKSIGRTVRQKFKARPNENKNKFLRNMLLAGGAGLVGGMLLGEATDDSPRPVVITAPPLIGGPRIDLGGLFGRGGLLGKGKGLL